MQTLFAETRKRGLLSSGLGMVANNKRYLFWFWALNLTLAVFGTAAFRRSAHAILDHSLYASGMLRGFDLGAFIEMLSRPEFGPMATTTAPALFFAFLFFVATALFLPGVFAGYASPYRLPREDFFHACGRNLWRFIRVMIVAGIVMSAVAVALFTLNGAIVKKAEESTNELLPFVVRMTGLAIVFLIMTTLRIWFDLAEADIVLNDQGAVRKSIASGFRHTFQRLGGLLGRYILTTILACILLVAGLWVWLKFVAPENIWGAFAVAQVTLFLLLIPRFWQRGVAVTYWQQKMLVPVATAPTTVAEPIVPESTPEVPPDTPAVPTPPAA
jgi:hypothetical protein